MNRFFTIVLPMALFAVAVLIQAIAPAAAAEVNGQTFSLGLLEPWRTISNWLLLIGIGIMSGDALLYVYRAKRDIDSAQAEMARFVKRASANDR